MKLNLAIATAALSLLGAISAQAQLTITVTPDSTATPTFGGDTVFSARVINTGLYPILIDGSGVTSSFSYFNIQDDLIVGELPITLAPGDSKDLSAFELLLNGATNYDYTYLLTSSDPNLPSSAFVVPGTTIVALATFPGASAVPEPGSVALLASSLIGGGLFVARRRRK